jgi:hypothetical protein
MSKEKESSKQKILFSVFCVTQLFKVTWPDEMDKLW